MDAMKFIKNCTDLIHSIAIQVYNLPIVSWRRRFPHQRSRCFCVRNRHTNPFYNVLKSFHSLLPHEIVKTMSIKQNIKFAFSV